MAARSGLDTHWSRTQIQNQVWAAGPGRSWSHLLVSGATHSAISDSESTTVHKSLPHRSPRRSEPLGGGRRTGCFGSHLFGSETGDQGRAAVRWGALDPKWVLTGRGMQVSHKQWKSCESTASPQGQNTPSGRGNVDVSLHRKWWMFTKSTVCLQDKYWLWQSCCFVRCLFVKQKTCKKILLPVLVLVVACCFYSSADKVASWNKSEKNSCTRFFLRQQMFCINFLKHKFI